MRHAPSVLVALAALAGYAFLCPAAPGPGDASEFTLVLATNGVAHPTGYPLYTLFGHWFCVLLHSFGVPWPLAANLLSAVGAAVAVGFLHALGVELAGGRAGDRPLTLLLAALVPVALLAFQPILLEEAVSAEVNSWSLAWACGAAYAFVCLAGALCAAGPMAVGPLRRGAALWGLVCGVGLAHHLTSVLVSAPLTAGLVVLLGRRGRLSPWTFLAGAAAALVPLAGYGIIAWHAWHPAPVQWPALTAGMRSVLDHVTGEQYRHFVGYFDPAPEQRELLARAGYPFLFAGLAFLLLGAARARELEHRITWGALLTAAALVSAFTFRYGVPDPAPYFLPAMALGAAAATPALAALARGRRGPLTLGALAAAGVFLVVPWIREGAAWRRDATDFEATVRSMWSAVPPAKAIVFWPDDRYIRLRAYQILDGEKPALWIATPDMLLNYGTRLEFHARFGFDPIGGLQVPRVRPGSPGEKETIRRFLVRVVRGVNERTPLPVIIFDPSVPIVRQLRKPWEPAEGPGPHPAGTGRP